MTLPLVEKTTDQSKGSKDHDDPLGDTLEEKILSAIKQDPSVTQQELAAITGVSVPTVKRIMQRMVREERITRVGGKRYGHWE